MARRALLPAAIAIGVIVAVGGITLVATQPHHQPNKDEFCFAEWCLRPAAMEASGSSTSVVVVVRSAARSATQRPDHPQAWLDDGQGHIAGGPQFELDGAVGPGQQYSTALTFDVTPQRCATFIVSEGAWPPFLGLGYAPSPFTERVAWRLCT